MERPYVFMQRALVTFKAAGLHYRLPALPRRNFGCSCGSSVMELWRRACLRSASKSWPESVIFRGCTIWTKLFMTLKKGCCWHGGARRSTGQTVTSLICLIW